MIVQVLVPVRAMHIPNWHKVGPRGKHKKVSVPVPSSCSPSLLNHVAQTPDPSPHILLPSNESASLSSLPATALASIFHHLDCASALRLATTCHTCAAEYHAHVAEFAGKCWDELTPTVTCDDPDLEELQISEHEHRHVDAQDTYGYDSPVVLRVKWEHSQTKALDRIHTMSQTAGFLEELWRRTWPQKLWADLMADGMPELQPHLMLRGGPYSSCVCVHILMASDTFLQLPWDWLKMALQCAPAAALTQNLNANGLQQNRTYEFTLHRPAQLGRTQEVMFRYFPHPQETLDELQDADDSRSVVSFDWLQQPASDVYVRPEHQQMVAVTGSWCVELPDAHEKAMACSSGMSPAWVG